MDIFKTDNQSCIVSLDKHTSESHPNLWSTYLRIILPLIAICYMYFRLPPACVHNQCVGFHHADRWAKQAILWSGWADGLAGHKEWPYSSMRRIFALLLPTLIYVYTILNPPASSITNPCACMCVCVYHKQTQTSISSIVKAMCRTFTDGEQATWAHQSTWLKSWPINVVASSIYTMWFRATDIDGPCGSTLTHTHKHRTTRDSFIEKHTSFWGCGSFVTDLSHFPVYFTNYT